MTLPAAAALIPFLLLHPHHHHKPKVPHVIGSLNSLLGAEIEDMKRDPSLPQDEPSPTK